MRRIAALVAAATLLVVVLVGCVPRPPSFCFRSAGGGSSLSGPCIPFGDNSIPASA